MMSGARQIGGGGQEMFQHLAQKTGDLAKRAHGGLQHADGVVRASITEHGGVRKAAMAFAKDRPVTVAAGTVAGVTVAGGAMAAALSPRDQGRAQAR